MRRSASRPSCDGGWRRTGEVARSAGPGGVRARGVKALGLVGCSACGWGGWCVRCASWARFRSALPRPGADAIAHAKLLADGAAPLLVLVRDGGLDGGHDHVGHVALDLAREIYHGVERLLAEATPLKRRFLSKREGEACQGSGRGVVDAPINSLFVHKFVIDCAVRFPLRGMSSLKSLPRRPV